jgi:tetratricopeptide (TPR) repeat protein
MGTQRIGGRSSFGLYAGLIVILALVIFLVFVFLVVVPDRQRQREAELQRIQANAAADARTSEVQRSYAAGGAFASAGDWGKAADEFAKTVSLDPAYKDAAARLAEARNKAEATKIATAAQIAATATAQALSEIESAYQRGLAYLNLKRWAQAKSELDKVVNIDPNYRDTRSRLIEVEGKLSEAEALTPTATLAPSASSTPKPTATLEVKSPSLAWLGFSGDQVGSGDMNSPDGKSDGVFELTVPDNGRTVTHVLLATPNGVEHWDSDGQESWVLGVLDGANGRRLNRIGALMDYRIDGVVKLRLYAAVAGTGFRPGERYQLTVRFSDGYMLELPIQIP